MGEIQSTNKQTNGDGCKGDGASQAAYSNVIFINPGFEAIILVIF